MMYNESLSILVFLIIFNKITVSIEQRIRYISLIQGEPNPLNKFYLHQMYQEDIGAYQKYADCVIKDSKTGEEHLMILSLLKIKSDVASGLSLCTVDKNPIIESPCSLSETPERTKAWAKVYEYLMTSYLVIDPLLIHEIDLIADAWLMTFLQQHIVSYIEKSDVVAFMKIDKYWLFNQFASRSPMIVLKKFLESDYKKNQYFYPAPFYNLCQWVHQKLSIRSLLFDAKKWVYHSSTIIRTDNKEVILGLQDVTSFMVVFPIGVSLKPNEMKLHTNVQSIECEVYEIDENRNRVSPTDKTTIKTKDSYITLVPFMTSKAIKGLEIVVKSSGTISLANFFVHGEPNFDHHLLFGN